MLPFANAATMDLHLAEISANVVCGAHVVLAIDSAGWHQTRDKLRVPDNITLLHLPPYSPELNAVENFWAYLRRDKLSNRVFDTYEAIIDARCDAWLWFAGQPERITSTKIREWACASQWSRAIIHAKSRGEHRDFLVEALQDPRVQLY